MVLAVSPAQLEPGRSSNTHQLELHIGFGLKSNSVITIAKSAIRTASSPIRVLGKFVQVYRRRSVAALPCHPGDEEVLFYLGTGLIPLTGSEQINVVDELSASRECLADS
jgi:hypothetical protein